jgi:fucose 4-O-acetylase-like acetyltransferase
MKTRIYFLDNLRTFLIFPVVLLHSAISYSHGMDSFWVVVDPQKSESLGLVNMYLDLFVMFIMFFISGYFIPPSLKNRNSLEFIKSKFKRIMIPWGLAVLTLIPAYKALFLYSRGLPQEEWYSYFTFFHRSGTDLYFYPNSPTLSWLWFLPVLFIFQIAYLGLSKANLLSFTLSLKTAASAIFILGLIYTTAISLAGLRGWFHSPLLDFQRERLLIYFMSFLLGALCYKLRIFDSQKKNKLWYVIANIVLTVSLGIFTVFALNFFFNIVDPQRNHFIISETADKISYNATAILSMLSFLYVFIHLFRFNFNKTNTRMEQLNKSSYSVYIIHMIVLGVIALLLTILHIPAFIKFIILTVLTYTLSNGIVLVYQRWFKRNVSLRLTTFSILVIVLFGFILFANKPDTPVNSEAIRSAPDMGLHEAVIRNDLQVVLGHIRAGSDLNVKDPTGGSSPLIVAALPGKTEIAQALIEAGADLDLQNNEGSTALHIATFFCRPEIVKALLEHSSDASIKNNAGSTALESVTAPFEAVKGIYDYFRLTLGPLGLELDDEQLKAIRPIIADLLRN